MFFTILKNRFVLFSLLFTIVNTTLHTTEPNFQEAQKNTEYKEKFSSRTFYQIAKEGKIHGYLLGSMHALSDKKLQQKFNKYLLPWLQCCETLYTEIPFTISKEKSPPRKDKYAGVEKIALNVIQNNELKIDLKGFNSDLFQISMGVPSFYCLHNFDYSIKYPFLALLTKLITTMSLASFVINETPPCISVPSLLLMSMTFSYDSSAKIARLFSKYQKNLLKEKQSFTFKQKSLMQNYKSFLFERNEEWIETIKKNNSERPIFYLIGAAHLPGPSGMLDLLERNGYQVKPLSLWSTPENPQFLEDTYTTITDEQRKNFIRNRPTYFSSLSQDIKYLLTLCSIKICFDFIKSLNLPKPT